MGVPQRSDFHPQAGPRPFTPQGKRWQAAVVPALAAALVLAGDARATPNPKKEATRQQQCAAIQAALEANETAARQRQNAAKQERLRADRRKLLATWEKLGCQSA